MLIKNFKIALCRWFDVRGHLEVDSRWLSDLLWITEIIKAIFYFISIQQKQLMNLS